MDLFAQAKYVFIVVVIRSIMLINTVLLRIPHLLINLKFRYGFALPYFNYAYIINEALCTEGHSKESANQQLIGHYRRHSLLVRVSMLY